MGISSGIRTAQEKQDLKMVLWVTIENPASGLVVALSSNYNGAQLHLEREVFGKADQLWDYEEAMNNHIFRNKAGFVADVKGTHGPEVICWPHHGRANQRFRHYDGKFITSEIGNKVWEIEAGPVIGYLPAGDNVPGYQGVPCTGPDDCAKMCNDVKGCAGWTFQKSTNQCWLKTINAGVIFDEDWVSGGPGISK